MTNQSTRNLKTLMRKDFQQFPSFRLSVFGLTGSGKSFLVNKLLPALVSSKSRKGLYKWSYGLIYDVKDEYHDVDLAGSGNAIERIVDIEYKGHLLSPLESLEAISYTVYQHKKWILYIEEISSVVPKSGRLYDVSPNFAKLLQQGRARMLSLIMVCQRPQETHTTLLSQSSHVISFYLHDKRDRERLKAYFTEEQFESLREYEFLYWDQSMKQGVRCYKIKKNF